MARVESIDASATSKRNTSTNNNTTNNTTRTTTTTTTNNQPVRVSEASLQTYMRPGVSREQALQMVAADQAQYGNTRQGAAYEAANNLPSQAAKDALGVGNAYQRIYDYETSKGNYLPENPYSVSSNDGGYSAQTYSEPSYEGGGFDYMSFFNQLMDSLNSNYNNLYNMLQQNLADSKASLNANNEESLRQAYINYMMNKRNMQRDMDENGINGGAAETTLARMYNDYGTNRRLINAQTEEQLRQLMQSHNSNMASVAQNQANNQLSAQLALAQMMK